jgi:3-hydroxyisobutyrate dehydrogenase-like beta-hydroxyacid dehydrogenase
MRRALGERLIANGKRVLGHDIAHSAVNGFKEAGGFIAANASAVFATCDLVILSLPTDQEVRQVLHEVAGALRHGQRVVDTTTGDPMNTVGTARELENRGLDYLDATLSGNSEQLRRGQTLWMVGGRKEAFDRCTDLFRNLAPHVVYTGPSGTGAQMKLVTNLVLGLNRAALAEGLAFAAALDLDLPRTLEVLRASMAYSRIMDSKGEKMIRGDFEPQAKLSQHLKDVKLIQKAAASAAQHLPLSAAHRELLETAERMGLGALDNSALFRAVQAQRSPDVSP